LEEHTNGRHILDREIDLFGDLSVRITPRGEHADRMDQLQRALVTPRQILDETHDVAVFFRGLDHEGGDFGLAQCYESLKPTLTAYKVIARSTGALAYCHRLLQPEMRDAIDQLLKDTFVTHSRV